jgi:two-component system nitrate/nitrite sensor histidine kinase NarX
LGFPVGWWLVVSLGVGLSGWALALSLRARLRARDHQAAREQDELETTRSRLAQSENRLQAVLPLYRSLVQASTGGMDGPGLMDTALSGIAGLAGAAGCSFVPIDEWRQPLPAFTYGRLPEAVMTAWSAQLANGMLRERCGSCTVLESTPGGCPLHPGSLGRSLTVYCIVQRQPGRRLASDTEAGCDPPAGVLHLYLPAGRSIDAETYPLLSELLDQVAIAFEATRLRQQEEVTLRQLQKLHAPQGDFAASLGVLLEGLVQALEVDFALIHMRSSPEERQSDYNVQCGDLPGHADAEIEAIVAQAVTSALQGRSNASQPGAVPVWLSLPLLLPEDGEQGRNSPAVGRGILLVGVNHPYEFHSRQRAILEAVAGQAALLVENERLVRSLEYKITIQERARLAREIHDGLAQTLAFLKLQAAQMQSYLAQGDLSRLANILKEYYQVLAAAYLDTRQAIDDLHLTPQDGPENWLEQILAEFENSTGLLVQRDIRPLSRPLAPEVQAQLVRIVQESLSNVRKHARARQVCVDLFERQGETILEVSDDGQGFDAEDVPAYTRHGLRGMRERAELLGADFQIISQAFQGTTMRLVLPASLAEEPSP